MKQIIFVKIRLKEGNMGKKVYCSNCVFSDYQWYERYLINIWCNSNSSIIDKPDTQEKIRVSCYDKNIKNDCKEFKSTVSKRLKDMLFRLYLRIKYYIKKAMV